MWWELKHYVGLRNSPAREGIQKSYSLPWQKEDTRRDSGPRKWWKAILTGLVVLQPIAVQVMKLWSPAMGLKAAKGRRACFSQRWYSNHHRVGAARLPYGFVVPAGNSCTALHLILAVTCRDFMPVAEFNV